jgi:predicted O-linked N-acetylglucosamine transferase (SPINDLY family)
MKLPPSIPGREQQSVHKADEQQQVHLKELLQKARTLHQQGRLTPAKVIYEEILEQQPQHFEALHLLGLIAGQCCNSKLARLLIKKALDINPHHAPAHNHLGHALLELGYPDEALESYDRAISIAPNYVDAHLNRGNALRTLKRLEEALASYDNAIAKRPNYAAAFNNRGVVLHELKRLQEALASYDRAISLQPNYADAFNNRAAVLHKLNRMDEALANYDQAIVIKPDYAAAFNNRATTLIDLKRLDEAQASYERVSALNPSYEFLLGNKLHTQLLMCNWSELPLQLERAILAIEEGRKVTRPFPLLGLTDEPALQQKAASIYVGSEYPYTSALGDCIHREPSEKIRIGYYSADFHNHATCYLMAELFEFHDKKKFELYGFSFGPDRQDAMRDRVSSSFNHFFDVTKKSDREVALMSRNFGIDIAVDLKGFTKHERTGIFSHRAAPLQVNYLGYPGTLGAPYFDYIVADRTVIPEESKRYYSEKIVYLPQSYQVNDSKRRVSPRVYARRELGLPENSFVFCCFNNNYKILPKTFDVWMRLLKKVSGSVLWLLEDNPIAASNLRKEAEIRGVDSARLIFAPRMELAEHLARHRAADLFLDTLPYNAHTTASDALRAGLPLLTQMGQSFASRVAASLLYAMDLPELITETWEDYETKAIELATNHLQLAKVREKLSQNLKISTLFNPQHFARHIEAAYTTMYKRHLDGREPDHFDVPGLADSLQS